MADAKSFVQFVKRYGPLPPRPEEQSLGLPGHREIFENPVGFGEIQLVLRSAWRGDNSAIDLIAAEDQETARDRWHLFLQNKAESAGIERKTFEGSPIEWSPADPIRARVSVGTNLEIVVEDLWSLIRLLFLQDHRGDRTRICNNEKCLAPYFVQHRRGQQYCGPDCATAVASRRYRQKVKKALKRLQQEERARAVDAMRDGKEGGN